MKSVVLAVSAALLLSSCAAYKAQHATAQPAPKPARVEIASEPAPAAHEHAKVDPLAGRQMLLISEIDKFQEELKANGLYDCCVKPACRQCIAQSIATYPRTGCLLHA